jgi:hypothetical protein
MLSTDTIEMRLVDESANTSNFEKDNQNLPPKHCQCLPGCTELRYGTTISSGLIFGNLLLNKEYAEIMKRELHTTNYTYFRLDKIFLSYLLS